MVICVKTQVKDEHECCYINIPNNYNNASKIRKNKLNELKKEWKEYIKNEKNVQYMIDIFLDMMKSKGIEFNVINADEFFSFKVD